MKLHVGAKVLIQNNKQQYLLIQRSDPLPDGTGIKWDIPGGRIDPGERLEDALAREVQEEIGITLAGAPQLVAAQDIILPELDLHVVRLTYTATFDGDVRLGDEHQKYRWATSEEALALNVDPYLREVLASL